MPFSVGAIHESPTSEIFGEGLERMKHIFNFVPAVKFRQGSSFMFKTIIAILWSIPLALALYTLAEYSYYENLTAYLGDFSATLENKHREFQKNSIESRFDKKEFLELSKRTVSYFRNLKAMTFSWTSLFGELEKLLPGGVKINRIRIKPATSVNLTVDGEATGMTDLTDFLRGLFASDRFYRPRLSHHATASTASSGALVFNLNVDYLPPLEIQP